MSDVRRRIIPDSVCTMIILTGLMQLSPVRLFGVFTALPLLIAAICRKDSIGNGDIKLTVAAGSVLGNRGCRARKVHQSITGCNDRPFP